MDNNNNTNTIIFNASVGSIVVNTSTNNIIITFYAMKYVGGSWSAVTENTAKFHITISLLA